MAGRFHDEVTVEVKDLEELAEFAGAIRIDPDNLSLYVYIAAVRALRIGMPKRAPLLLAADGDGTGLVNLTFRKQGQQPKDHRAYGDLIHDAMTLIPGVTITGSLSGTISERMP
jgi:hypothetical protein